MSQAAPKRREAKPYKGPESYQIEDADLFFGREQESSRLIAQILSARMTLLHAQSGAGKSSLLNARVIPGLESRGSSVVRILFNNSPINCVREVTLASLTPPPAAELQAIDEAIDLLCAPGEEISLADLLARFDQLQTRDVRRRRITSPIIDLTGSDQDYSFQVSMAPYFCRMVRATLDVEGFAEHLLAVYQQTNLAKAAELPLQINGQTLMSELREFIASPALIAAYRELIAELSSAPAGLTAFFEKLFEVYGRRRSRFSLVLIFDQFEELFTRFIDPGPSQIKLQMDLPDWKLKWELINQLEELYGSETDSTNTLPIRYVISMRDEYIAQLGPIRQFAWNLDKNSFHLGLLDKDQAALAIKQPAALFGYTYAEDCYQRIITELTLEDRYVEPKHLQLVCDKLWNQRGREIAKQTAENNPGQPRGEVEYEVLEKLEGVPGILKAFFQDFLDDLNSADRLEALEMLEPLVTASGTRNIMEREVLLNAPFRDRARRARLLNQLIDRTIVRTESRLGGYFIEITHEFLIGPILDALRDELSRDFNHYQLRLALRMLERLSGDRDFQTDQSLLLKPEEFEVLDKCKKEIFWNSWSSEMMYRNAIRLAAPAAVIKEWAVEVDRLVIQPETKLS